MRSIATDGITARFVGLSVCPSVCLPVGHARETCKSGQTDRDAVRDIESGLPYRNHVLDGGPDLPSDGAIWRGTWRSVVKYRNSVVCAKTAEPIEMQFGMLSRVRPCIRWG